MGHGECDNFSRTQTLAAATDDGTVLGTAAVALLTGLRCPPTEIRGLGLHVSRLFDAATGAALGDAASSSAAAVKVRIQNKISSLLHHCCVLVQEYWSFIRLVYAFFLTRDSTVSAVAVLCDGARNSLLLPLGDSTQSVRYIMSCACINDELRALTDTIMSCIYAGVSLVSLQPKEASAMSAWLKPSATSTDGTASTDSRSTSATGSSVSSTSTAVVKVSSKGKGKRKATHTDAYCSDNHADDDTMDVSTVADSSTATDSRSRQRDDSGVFPVPTPRPPRHSSMYDYSNAAAAGGGSSSSVYGGSSSSNHSSRMSLSQVIRAPLIVFI
jgi:hypothetical protein